MMQSVFSGGIAAWVEFLGDANIPVLQHTTDSLILLKKQKAGPSARNVARIIRGDPLMMIRFSRYLQRCKNYPLQEAMHLEQALIMFGTQDILDDMAVCPFVEAMLQAHPAALIHLDTGYNVRILHPTTQLNGLYVCMIPALKKSVWRHCCMTWPNCSYGVLHQLECSKSTLCNKETTPISHFTAIVPKDKFSDSR